MEFNVILLLALFIVAVMYSSVGHGGASGYLAVMSLFAIDTLFFRSSALIMNLFVAGIAFINFGSGIKVRWRLFLPILLPAIPMALAGAMVHINPTTYKIILGAVLLLALLRLVWKFNRDYDLAPPPGILLSIAIGASLGFLSGMIGIGGGIILSPILILKRWAGIKETAVYSSLFILLNSIAGLIGLGVDRIALPNGFIYWILAVFSGGLAGSFTSIKYLPVRYFKVSLIAVLLFACFKLLVY